LRFLQERTYEPLGATGTVKADVRVIAATNKDLATQVKKSEFRQDLFYRINVVALNMPSLVERLGDIPLLAGHFLRHFTKEIGREVLGFTEPAMAALQRYAWPGNVRELENAVERAVVLCRRPQIDVEDQETQFPYTTDDVFTERMNPGDEVAEEHEDGGDEAILVGVGHLGPEILGELALRRLQLGHDPRHAPGGTSAAGLWGRHRRCARSDPNVPGHDPGDDSGHVGRLVVGRIGAEPENSLGRSCCIAACAAPAELNPRDARWRPVSMEVDGRIFDRSDQANTIPTIDCEEVR
jgi:hypothetical protein